MRKVGAVEQALRRGHRALRSRGRGSWMGEKVGGLVGVF